MPMMAITTSNSISVNAPRTCRMGKSFRRSLILSADRSTAAAADEAARGCLFDYVSELFDDFTPKGQNNFALAGAGGEKKGLRFERTWLHGPATGLECDRFSGRNREGEDSFPRDASPPLTG